MYQSKSLRYPTVEQNKVWSKRRDGIAPSDVAEQMGVSRPYVSQAQRIAEERIEKLFRHTAKTSRIKLKHISPEYGIAVGNCPALETTVYFTYSPTLGVQVWYEHSGDCGACDRESECKELLDELSKEWDIPLEEGLPPTETGKILFEKIMEVLHWKR